MFYQKVPTIILKFYLIPVLNIPEQTGKFSGQEDFLCEVHI